MRKPSGETARGGKGGGCVKVQRKKGFYIISKQVFRNILLLKRTAGNACCVAGLQGGQNVGSELRAGVDVAYIADAGMCYKDPTITDEDLKWNGKADDDDGDAEEVRLATKMDHLGFSCCWGVLLLPWQLCWRPHFCNHPKSLQSLYLCLLRACLLLCPFSSNKTIIPSEREYSVLNLLCFPVASNHCMCVYLCICVCAH
jgi:hypothetical protein